MRDRPSISAAVLDAYHRAIALAESRFEMLVIGAGQKDFAYGADLGDAFDTAATGDTASARSRTRPLPANDARAASRRVPTIAVTRGVAISGGCEVLMHCTRVVAAPKSPIGLVETSIGVIPGGGGVKEMARRAALRAGPDDADTTTRTRLQRALGARIAYARDAKAFDLLTRHDVVVDDAICCGRQETRACVAAERIRAATAQSQRSEWAAPTHTTDYSRRKRRRTTSLRTSGGSMPTSPAYCAAATAPHETYRSRCCSISSATTSWRSRKRRRRRRVSAHLRNTGTVLKN